MLGLIRPKRGGIPLRTGALIWSYTEFTPCHTLPWLHILSRRSIHIPKPLIFFNFNNNSLTHRMLVIYAPGDSPPLTAPEQCGGPPSPLCACSWGTPTEATVEHWGSCWAVLYHSGLRPLPLMAGHCLCAHICIRGSDHQLCREPAGLSQRWMGSVVDMVMAGSVERKRKHMQPLRRFWGSDST